MTLLLVVSTLLALALCEAALRVADYPRADWSPWIRTAVTGTAYAPHLSQRWTTSEFDISYGTNAEGMRDDEIGPKRGYRVLLLGDSFAAGYGVEREQQFADLLERELGVEVVNAATGGWELEHQYYYVRERARALQPDLILYAMFLGNDILRNGARGGLGPQNVRIDVGGGVEPPAFKGRAQSAVTGTISAPAGLVRLGRLGSYRGAFVGIDVVVGGGAQVRVGSAL